MYNIIKKIPLLKERKNMLKKRSYFFLSIALCSTSIITLKSMQASEPKAPREEAISPTEETQPAATLSTKIENPGLFGGFFGWFSSPESTSATTIAGTTAVAPKTLSDQLQKQTIALLDLRKAQLETEKKLRATHEKTAKELMSSIKKTEGLLKEKPDEFVPALLLAIEKLNLALRVQEEAAAKDTLDGANDMNNYTKEQRGAVRAALKDNGQTKAHFRAQSPTETCAEFALRITDSGKKVSKK